MLPDETIDEEDISEPERIEEKEYQENEYKKEIVNDMQWMMYRSIRKTISITIKSFELSIKLVLGFTSARLVFIISLDFLFSESK